MTPEELKLISRVQKLHAMAEGARAVGSLAEAETFMEGVERTLAKHNLESSVLSMDLRDHVDPLGYSSCWGARKRHRTKPVRWAQFMAAVVAEAHFCVSLASVSSSGIWFYGRKSNHEMAVKMYLYLRDLAETLGWRAYRKYCAVGGVNANKWYLDWLEGFAAEVIIRYRAMRVRVDADRGMSLVRSTAYAEADRYSKAFEASPETLEQLKEPTWKGAGYRTAQQLGAAAARTANLRPNVVEGAEAPERRKING